MSGIDRVNTLWFLGWLVAMLALFGLGLRLPLQPRLSRPVAAFMAARTSGGRFVDVCVINSTMLSKKACIMRRV